jgi:hypothetical protein
MGDGMKRVSALQFGVGRTLLERRFQGQIEHRADYADHKRRAQKQFRSLRKN